MKLYRSQTNRTFAGVCGGLAEYLGWTAGQLWIVWVFATLFVAFTGVLIYLALWYLMLKEQPKPMLFDPPPLQPWKKQVQ